ncbi:unnamed protein product [Gadus morhua 'NCC']
MMDNLLMLNLGLLFLIIGTPFSSIATSSSEDAPRRREMVTATLSAFPKTLSDPAKGLGDSGCPGPTCDPTSSGPTLDRSSAGPRRRAKRCTCYSYKDKECVYYCHLDIIWINTPERLVPYGMSGSQGPRRLRRSARTEGGRRGAEPQPQRCACALESDGVCGRFCVIRQGGPSPASTEE